MPTTDTRCPVAKRRQHIAPCVSTGFANATPPVAAKRRQQNHTAAAAIAAPDSMDHANRGLAITAKRYHRFAIPTHKRNLTWKNDAHS